MNKNIIFGKNNHILLTIICFILGVGLNANSNFGLSVTKITVSSNVTLKKNISSLSFYVTADCYPSEKSLKTSLSKVKETILTKIEKKLGDAWESEVDLDEENAPSIDTYPGTKYRLNFTDKSPKRAVLINPCNKQEKSASDYFKLKDEKIYSGTLSVNLVATENIEQMFELQQFIKQCLDVEKSNNPRLNVDVSNAIPGVDKETIKAANDKLLEELELDAHENPNSVDKEFFKKYVEADNPFEVEHVTDDQGYVYGSAFEQIIPSLDENTGKASLKAKYIFDLSYIPSNLGSLGDTLDEKSVTKLNKSYPIDVEMSIPVTKYRLNYSLSTGCHSSALDASKAMKKEFEKAKKKATNIINGVDDSWQIVINRINTPSLQYGNYTPIERETVRSKINPNELIYVGTKWIDNCSGKIVDNTEDKYYQVNQSFTAVTSSYLDLKELQRHAKSINSNFESSFDNGSLSHSEYHKRILPRTSFSNIEVDFFVHRDLVLGAMYADALEKLSAIDGDVAKDMIDDNKAVIAYYNLVAIRSFNHHGKGNRGGRSFFPGVNEQAAESVSSPAYDGNITVDSSNTEDMKVPAHKSYTVFWKPAVDLLTVIKTKRKLAEKE